MYTVVERKDALEKLIEIISSMPNVEGCLLVGSGAIGFTDEWSDIDVSVVVYPEENTRAVWNELNKKILDSFSIYKYLLNEYGINNYITVILLKNFLEIDVGVISLNNLSAKREYWKVLFDKSSRVADKMKNTWENRKYPVLSTEIEQSLNSFWYNFKNAAFAIKRNKSYRAVKELEEIRNEIIRLKAIQEDKISKHYRDVDEMESWFIKRLENTFFGEIDIASLTNCFVSLLDLYFEVVKDMYRNCEVNEYEAQLRDFLYELGIMN
ncbi:nucleotidyltransferase domain-containing protein [Lutispora saccharofermentans]|uniref:Nucleotidyltransferase domain-containing protein n=1 Tax=Lutispora saccharofermentans TaxID=3024236 RepID=A0ABT1NFA6_9FIRM|nr:nucleotidyltransferase domain-containing protein [Lutispora saccharofermentans]MCQ1529937.1 nucleotidyltransferase domain-containing protein [Lutispora saccharofermentans]